MQWKPHNYVKIGMQANCDEKYLTQMRFHKIYFSQVNSGWNVNFKL